MGAWIETSSQAWSDKVIGVAPRVGAWIETAESSSNLKTDTLSHPEWVRGLKLGKTEST